ncbi:Protein DCL [Trema orientale]|uniref:Protein DCL n=1 Tax=Trema orientale TaxID=63057 RepID=A0A2P5F8U3_TREOI|nr:Protein DCL [Trema orientale]
MASISKPSPPPPLNNLHRYSLSSSHHCPVTLSFPLRSITRLSAALKTGSDGGRGSTSSTSSSSSSRIGSSPEVFGPGLLRKPVVSPRRDIAGISEEDEDENEIERKRVYEDEDEEDDEDRWVDWEDKILEDTVPLVGFVRMLIHSGKYESGERLSPEHEKIILEKLLPFHPECEKKIGCGIDYVTVGYHPDFERSRCLFIVQKDGNLVDFSYWKCIKGLIRKNYPLYADSFILRHFRQRHKHGL